MQSDSSTFHTVNPGETKTERQREAERKQKQEGEKDETRKWIKPAERYNKQAGRGERGRGDRGFK